MSNFPLALPEFVRFYETFPGFPFDVEPALGARPFLASLPPPPGPDPSICTVEKLMINGGQGGRDNLKVLIVKPVGLSVGELSPAILAIHGGGGVMGVPEQDLPLFYRFAAAGYTVLSPDYRLAPEHKSPAALSDVEATWSYMINTPALGLNIHKIGVYGSSAGSILATGLAIKLKGATIQPKICIMDSTLADDRVIYPSQAEDCRESKYHIWKRSDAIKCKEWIYDNQENLPVCDSPLRSQSSSDFEGLCPHFIQSCELDSLREHGSTYFMMLQAAGVEVEFHSWAGAPHGFMRLVPQSKSSELCILEYIRAFNGKLGSSL